MTYIKIIQCDGPNCGPEKPVRFYDNAPRITVPGENGKEANHFCSRSCLWEWSRSLPKP